MNKSLKYQFAFSGSTVHAMLIMYGILKLVGVDFQLDDLNAVMMYRLPIIRNSFFLIH